MSADDHLTASSGNDLLVFAQPIARDVIHNFDAVADKIDLIGFTGVSGFANLSIADDANGNAVITLANGSTITVLGVHAADLSAGNFEFNLEPVTINTGTMTISDGAILPLGGVIENSGTIALGSTGSETNLQVLVESLTLQGGGHVLLSDDANNVIFGGAANATLINVDNTISGAGQIGAGSMTLVNAGNIVASGTQALVIDTGSNAVVNSGTLSATGAGGLVIDSALVNSGGLWAHGGDVTILGDVSGSGSATISGDATLAFLGVSNQGALFDAVGNGTLVLGSSAAYSGSVSGLNAGDVLDFGDLVFGANATLSYASNATATGGVLSVSDGVHSAQVSLQGQYSAAGFQAAGDVDGSTAVAYAAPLADQILVGTAGSDVLVGGSGNDTIQGDEADDVIIGGFGADWLAGNAGNDTFVFAAGDTSLSIGGSGDAGTISGFDTIRDYSVISGGATVDRIDTVGTPLVVANTSGTDGTNSLLTIGGQAVMSHSITSGIITFDDADTFASALVIDSTQDVAAAVQYLQSQNFGSAGATVAFAANLSATTDTYLFTQGTASGANGSDVLVDLVGISTNGVANTAIDGYLFIL